MNELRFAYGKTGRSVSAMLFDAQGRRWNGTAFVAPSAVAASAWAAGAISCAEQRTSDSQPTGNYLGSLPGEVAAASVDAVLYFDGTLTLTSSAVGAQQFDAVAPLFAGVSSVARWLGVLAGAGPDTATLAEMRATAAGAGYDNATMSLEAQQAALRAATGANPSGFPCVLECNDTAGNPVPAVLVYTTSDPTGRTLVGGPATGDAGGAANLSLSAGRQYVCMVRSGYARPAPQPVTVSGPAVLSYSLLAPFVAPTAAPYAFRGDLENIFGVPNIIKWAILSQNDPASPAGLAEITARVDWAISVATVDFENAMRQGRYKLPISGSGATIWATNVVATMAGYWLYQHIRPVQRDSDGRPIPDRYDGIFTWAQLQMDYARSGKIRLDAAVSGKGQNAPEVTHSPSPAAYGRGQLGYGGPPLLPGPFVG